MIYCKLTDLKRYECLSHNLKRAIEFITSTDLKALPIGITEIQGSEIYINKTEIELKEVAPFFEVHHKYIDIHIDLETKKSTKAEIIESTYDKLMLTKPYDEKDDYELFESSSLLSKVKITMIPEFCAIYFTGEVHKPGICSVSFDSDKTKLPQKLTKCIIKVLDDTAVNNH